MNANNFHAIEKWDKPRDGLFRVITNAWWIVDDDGDPVVFTQSNSPQCNINRSIAERIANGQPIKQIPIVYLSVNASDSA